jgi:hypothetical protein
MPNTPVIANSLPLGGSFLLMKILESFGYQKYAKNQGTPQAFNYKEVKEALATQAPTSLDDNAIAIGPFAPHFVNQSTFCHWLEVVSRGEYISAHIPGTAAFAPIITQLNCRHIVIMRSAQSILTELVYGDEIMPRFLKADLEPLSLSERLNFFLSGGYAACAGVTVKSFAEIYRSMQAWRQDPTCLVVDFEDLISQNKQQELLTRMATYLGIQMDTMAVPLEVINNFPVSTLRAEFPVDLRRLILEPI